jgi:hypothetical protein
VLPDSDAQSTSGRDWKRVFFLNPMSHAEFRRDYPDAVVRDFDPTTIAKHTNWLSATRVTVAEFWEVRKRRIPAATDDRSAKSACTLTNGVELLAKKGQPKKYVWKGKYIPFAACLGRIVYKTDEAGDSKKMILSYIRFARDAAKGYNWTKSTMLEKIALPVRASLMGYEGQVDPTRCC